MDEFTLLSDGADAEPDLTQTSEQSDHADYGEASLGYAEGYDAASDPSTAGGGGGGAEPHRIDPYMVGYDEDGDSDYDLVVVDQDHDGSADMAMWDTNNDNEVDRIAFDQDHDGTVDVVYHDDDYDGRVDRVEDGDGALPGYATN